MSTETKSSRGAKNAPGMLFRCDASPEIGLGHIVRCLALADELRDSHGARVAFAMRNSALGCEMARRHGYPVLQAPRGEFDYAAWLEDALRQSEAQTLVVDVRDELLRSTLEGLSAKRYRIAVLDDAGERARGADFVFCPPVPQVRRANWNGFKGKLFVGWEWIILRKQFARDVRARERNGRNLLITMGGSDPANLTCQAVQATDELGQEFCGTVVVGRAFRHHQELQAVLRSARHRFKLLQQVEEMSAVMTEADVAICSFGMTAYELAAMGVPAIYLCLTPDHAESASALAESGMGWSLGVAGEVAERKLAEATEKLLADPALRRKMSTEARRQIDGKGAERIAEVLLGRSGESSHAAGILNR